ncbi:MAG: hypothetical protein LBF74_05930 [Treponema sp.]|jgi:hypothetical protein|nr:hypothetical protein [Treponema sp.]
MTMDHSALATAIYNEMRMEYWPDTVIPSEAEHETKRYYSVIARALTNYFGGYFDGLGTSLSNKLEEALAEHIQQYHSAGESDETNGGG